MTTNENVSAPAANVAPAPTVPTIDVAKVAESAAEAATKVASEMIEKKASEIATAQLREFGRKLSGEEAPDPGKQFLESFVSNPAKVLHGIKELTKKEIAEENKAIERVQTTQRNVVTPFINEYPELNSPKKLALVQQLASQKEAAGMSMEQALQEGCEEAVKEFNLKSVSDAAREGNYAATGLPGGGAYRPGAPKFNEAKSNSDFLAGMKSRVTSFRKKVS